MDFPGLYKFISQAIRDSVWVIGSPPVLKNSTKLNSVNFFETEFFHDQFLRFSKYLIQLNENPTKLNRFLENNNTRIIGKYFKRLVEFWLLHRDDIKLLGSSIRINNGNKNLGEFEFIYENLFFSSICSS